MTDTMFRLTLSEDLDYSYTVAVSREDDKLQELGKNILAAAIQYQEIEYWLDSELEKLPDNADGKHLFNERNAKQEAIRNYWGLAGRLSSHMISDYRVREVIVI